MYNAKPPQDPSQQWTVHAQFTISHDGLSDSNQPPLAHTEQDENGVRMVYTWSSAEGISQPPPPPPPNYGFQKGNMVFTSTPPLKKMATTGVAMVDDKGVPDSYPNRLGMGMDSSGYGSEISPNTNFQGPRGVSSVSNCLQNLQGRRCRSTCSIVLSTNVVEVKGEDGSEASLSQGSASRTHSLRCQTPTQRSTCSGKDATYYGCGDPWCYHSNYPGEDGRFSPVPEGEEYVKRASRASTYSGHHERSRSSPPRMEKSRDAAVQTYEMIDKCTSPFLRMDSFDFKNARANNNKDYRERSLKKRGMYNARRKTEPIFNARGADSPSSSLTPDSLDSSQKINTKRIVRNPPVQATANRLQAPKEVKNSTTSTTTSSDPNKKPRTVHIDVYCTGTEQDTDSSSSSSDSEEKTGSSPQTVFESGKVRITHKRSEDDLPYHMQDSKTKISQKPPSPDIETVEEGISSGYPSRSSFSGCRDSRDFDSSFCSSVPPSWSTMSVSVPDAADDTSWKDTYSDLGSWSRSSIAATESMDFVPRKVASNLNATRSSISEQPELDLLHTPSVQMSDSFEYANSEDRFRIKKMEDLWHQNQQQHQQQQQRSWKSPQVERQHHLQQQKMKEYFEKRLGQSDEGTKSECKDTDSDNSDAGSEKGWSFIKDEPRRQEDKNNNTQSTKTCNEDNRPLQPKQTFGKALVMDENTRLVTACKSPSILIIKQKMTANPSLRAPFTVLPGVFTEQREIARKFGRIVDVFKKPGHHVGPAKNPDCTCDHCREYFLRYPSRNRARSVDSQYSHYYNWKGAARGSVPPEERTLPTKETNKSVTHLGFSDF